MKITKVVPSEIDSVMLLLNTAVADMQKNGLYQWDEHYPNQKVLSADIAAGSLYAVRIDETLAGIMAINENQAAEYQCITWADNFGRPLVVHRLCIHPTFQRQGLAGQLMSFAENFARENRYTSIRLDAFSKNAKALALYESLKYQRRGTVSFRRGEFYCYEKVLKTNS